MNNKNGNLNNNNMNNNIINQDFKISKNNGKINEYKNNINDIKDDDYLIYLHQRLSKVKELRKISENGVIILNGQIRRLKDENKKSILKKISENKKANDKLVIMERKKKQSKEIIEMNKKLDDDLIKLKEKNYNKKVERDFGIINSKKKIISQNKLKAKLSQKEKEDICNQKIMNELNDKIIKKNKVENLRSLSLQKRNKYNIDEFDINGGILGNYINENYSDEDLMTQIDKLLQNEELILEKINQNNEIQKELIEKLGKF